MLINYRFQENENALQLARHHLMDFKSDSTFHCELVDMFPALSAPLPSMSSVSPVVI